MSKPKVSYAEFIASQVKHPINSVAHWIEEYVKAMSQPGARGVSEHQRNAYDILQRSPLAKKDVSELTLDDYDEHARLRRQNLIPTFMHRNSTCPLKEISPTTVGKDFSDLSVILTWAHDRRNAVVNLERLRQAKRILKGDGLISKSQPRDRRPTDEELARLEEYFDAQNGLERTEVDMVMMARWQRYSCRRIGESCALRWEDWNRDERTILVRKMKDPKRKNKAKVVALTESAHVMLEQIWFQRGYPTEGLIFGFNKRTISSRYTLAKKVLGIDGLRLHDSRRDGASKLIESGCTISEVAAVTGHEPPYATLERTYGKPSIALLAQRISAKTEGQQS